MQQCQEESKEKGASPFMCRFYYNLWTRKIMYCHREMFPTTVSWQEVILRSSWGQWQVIHDWTIWPVLAFDLQSNVHSHFSPPRKAILHGGAIYAGLGALTAHTEETGSCCAAPDWHHTRGWSRCPASVSSSWVSKDASLAEPSFES